MGQFLPDSPSWDTDALDDTDANLGDEHKKEHHEVEGAVTPVKRKTKEQCPAPLIPIPDFICFHSDDDVTHLKAL